MRWGTKRRPSGEESPTAFAKSEGLRAVVLAVPSKRERMSKRIGFSGSSKKVARAQIAAKVGLGNTTRKGLLPRGVAKRQLKSRPQLQSKSKVAGKRYPKQALKIKLSKFTPSAGQLT